jgi:glycosyltransferase involved in cell wall biosynthesis
MPGRPKLSVVICTYNMAREAPRTVRSALPPYQKGVEPGDIEVIVIDNGSTLPLPPMLQDRADGVQFIRMPEPRPSPVFAMNFAAGLCRGDHLLFAIDGARIFSERLYAETLRAHAIIEDAFVYTLGWHLGRKVQMESVQEGYDQAAEDALLDKSGWPDDPDALFDISVLGGSSGGGYFSPIAESNAFSMSRQLFHTLGGYDERFMSPGGGLANLELFSRYVTRPSARNLCLLSEGTFHQVHGGIATSGKSDWGAFNREFEAIYSRPFAMPNYEALLVGRPRRKARRFFVESLERLDQSQTAVPAFTGAP